jgi:hypothetical protein
MGAQKIAYVSDATGGKSNARAEEVVVTPPSAKLVQTLRSAFVTSLYKALSGMVENAEKVKKEDDKGAIDPDGVTVPQSSGVEGENAANAADGNNRVRRSHFTKFCRMLTRDAEHPHAPHLVESNPSSPRLDPTFDLDVRVVLFRLSDRRNKDYPRCFVPNRCPPVPILRPPYCRATPEDHLRRRNLSQLGTSSVSETTCRRQALHLRRPTGSRVGA